MPLQPMNLLKSRGRICLAHQSFKSTRSHQASPAPFRTCRMSIQRFPALLLVSLNRSITRPAILPCWSHPLACKAHRCLATNSSPAGDSSKPSPRTGSGVAAVAAADEKDKSRSQTLLEPDPSLPIVEYDTRTGPCSKKCENLSKSKCRKSDCGNVAIAHCAHVNTQIY